MGNSLDSYYLGDSDKVVWESAIQAARQAYDQVPGARLALAHAMGGVDQFNGIMILGAKL